MELIPFPGSEIPASLRVQADATWDGRILELRFSVLPSSLVANLSEASLSRARRDELWKTTCFECFLTTEDPGLSYYEINFSPGGDWAFYRFGSYRAGLEKPVLARAPERVPSSGESLWSYRLDLSDQEELKGRKLRTSLCAVIEPRKGPVSYWSLVHRQSKPDFHHPDHFVHVLSPKE